MDDKILSKQLYLNTEYGLKRVFGILNQDGLNGLSIEELRNYSKIGINDASFAQFLEQNFQKINSNQDDNLSVEELNKMVSTITEKGFSYEQLLSITSQGNLSEKTKAMLDNVVSNFQRVDTNGDGKLSSAEIDTYNHDKEVEKKKDKLSEVKSTNFSMFYGDDTDLTTNEVNDDK